jgi:hypothetical protein
MSGHDPEDNESLNDLLAKKSRTLFDQASGHLDPAIGNRLRLMRREALASARQRMPHRWLPLGAAAATLLGIGLTWWLPQHSATVQPGKTSVNATDQDLLPEDDTEIYTWLGEAPVAVDGAKAGSR